jgi:ABC-type sugar transport system ATPase subunit
MGRDVKSVKSRTPAIGEWAGVTDHMDFPLRTFSSGMVARLAFSTATDEQADVLLVDEVLSVGDADFQKKCLGKMKDVSTKEGRTVLFVSHNMSVVSALCGKGYILKNGEAVYDGPITEAIDKYYEGVQLRSNYKFAPDESIEASILEVSIIDQTGRHSSTISFGQKWKIKVKVKVNLPLKNFVVAFKLFDLFNYPVRSVWMPAQVVEEGLYAIEFTEHELLFATGTYKIVLGLSVNNRYFQYKDDNIYFTITENSVQTSFNFENKNQRAGFVLNPMATEFYKL